MIMKSRVFAKLIRSAMVACFVLGSCLVVTTGCQENGKACPATCPQKKACCKHDKKECEKKHHEKYKKHHEKKAAEKK